MTAPSYFDSYRIASAHCGHCDVTIHYPTDEELRAFHRAHPWNTNQSHKVNFVEGEREDNERTT